jgi:hypothetical protein
MTPGRQSRFFPAKCPESGGALARGTQWLSGRHEINIRHAAPVNSTRLPDVFFFSSSLLAFACGLSADPVPCVDRFASLVRESRGSERRNRALQGQRCMYTWGANWWRKGGSANGDASSTVPGRKRSASRGQVCVALVPKGSSRWRAALVPLRARPVVASRFHALRVECASISSCRVGADDKNSKITKEDIVDVR